MITKNLSFTIGSPEVKRVPLWYHRKFLSQTVSGYGRKLVTEYKILFKNKWRRVYNCCFSNSGTNYILDTIRDENGKRAWITIDMYSAN